MIPVRKQSKTSRDPVPLNIPCDTFTRRAGGPGLDARRQGQAVTQPAAHGASHHQLHTLPGEGIKLNNSSHPTCCAMRMVRHTTNFTRYLEKV